jgi:hypothetical protein
MTRPNFLIIGAAKAGTTTLWKRLREHPQVCMSQLKEPLFFSHDESFAKGWDWYASLFQPNAATRAIGEATPHYSVVKLFPKALERIARHLPDARILYAIRDPATALPSFWKQLHAWGAAWPDRSRLPDRFDHAVENYPPMLELVRYWQNLQAFRAHFADSRIKVLFFEDLIRNPRAALDECSSFLEIDPHEWSQATRVENPSTGKFSRPRWDVRLRGTPLWGLMRFFIPQALRRPIMQAVSRPIPDTVSWEGGLADRVRASLAEDARQILAFGGKPADFWKIAPS